MIVITSVTIGSLAIVAGNFCVYPFHFGANIYLTNKGRLSSKRI